MDEDEPSATLTLQPRGGAPRSVPVVLPPAIDRSGTLEGFRRSVQEGASVLTAASDTIRRLAIVLAAVDSIETGVAVDVAALLEAESP